MSTPEVESRATTAALADTDTDTDTDVDAGAGAEADAGAEEAVGTADAPERRGRRWVRWLAALAWPAALIGGGIALYAAYLHVSRTLAVSSDGASNALQAWDMLHGNPLLRGWTVTDVSFYTTELPEYMLVEAVRGLHADVLHIAAAISYTLVVLSGGLLARGRAKGREGLVRFAIAAGIMVAPQLGPGAFILVFQPDHIGTQVPLLLTWLVLDRAPRSWYVPPVIAAMLAWAAIADRIVVLIGAAPLAAVCAVRAYQALVQRREGLRSAWFDLSLVAAAGAAVEISSIVVRQIGQHGGYSVLPVASNLAPVTDMSNHFWLAVQSVFGLYGADFFGMSSLGLDAGIAFLHVSGLALAAWALCRVLRRFFGCDDRIAQILAVAILVNLVAYVWSPVPTTYWSARELAGVLPAGAVLAGRMLGARFRTGRLVPAGAVLLACYLAALGYTAAQDSVPAKTQYLANWLGAHHLTYGLSSYGVANTTTLASGGAVAVRPLNWLNGNAAAGPYEYDQAWYDPQKHNANFVVLINPPSPLNPVAFWQAYDAFGRPTHVYTFENYVIMTYDTNLLTDLSPSALLTPVPGTSPTPAPAPSLNLPLQPSHPATPAHPAAPAHPAVSPRR
jgi:hypothetical protein